MAKPIKLSTWTRTPNTVRKALAQSATNPLVRTIVRRRTSSKLRVLGYHGVDDPNRFEEQLDRILRTFTPVDGDDVARAIAARVALPSNAVWFTFDDGLKSTFDVAELLASRGVRGTLFVNPAVLDQPGLLWFQVHEFASAGGLIGVDEAQEFSLQRLKTVPDAERRLLVDTLSQRLLRAPGTAPRTVSGTPADMGRWIETGHEIGNHTWDHPCLDQCSSQEQRVQVERAHHWLVAHGASPRFLAYPNGDWADPTAQVAADLGYVGSVLFDHALADPHGDPHRISRLRLDAAADHRRVDAVLSGAHSLMFSGLQRLGLGS